MSCETHQSDFTTRRHVSTGPLRVTRELQSPQAHSFFDSPNFGTAACARVFQGYGPGFQVPGLWLN